MPMPELSTAVLKRISDRVTAIDKCGDLHSLLNDGLLLLLMEMLAHLGAVQIQRAAERPFSAAHAQQAAIDAAEGALFLLDIDLKDIPAEKGAP